MYAMYRRRALTPKLRASAAAPTESALGWQAVRTAPPVPTIRATAPAGCIELALPLPPQTLLAEPELPLLGP
jgi:hypothetical protein